MKKMVLIIATMLMTGMVYAKGIEETIQKVEVQKDAKCTHYKSTVAVCLGDPAFGVCTNWEKFKCVPNDVSKEAFKVSLKVRQVGVNKPVVKKITYTYKQ